jgi:hypothetical protein
MKGWVCHFVVVTISKICQFCLMILNTIFVMATILPSSDSAPLRSVSVHQLVKLLLAFASRVVPGFSLLKILAQNFCSPLDNMHFEMGPPLQ